MTWRKVVAVMMTLTGAVPVASAAGLIYPGVVRIEDFRTEKVMYKPGEKVRFRVRFVSRTNHEKNAFEDLRVQVWLERELVPSFLATSQGIKTKDGAPQTVTLTWQNADKDVFGHRAYVRFVDPQGRLLAEADTLFDIASNWAPIMRLGCTHRGWDAGFTDEQIRGQIQVMREGHFNALEMFGWFPKSYVLAPKTATWSSQYYPPPKNKPVSRERLQAWGRELHRNGMKYVAYNETSAIEGPQDWHVYLEYTGFEKPYAHYFARDGMFTPNALKVAGLFADQLEQSIRLFGWDGILMDSAVACYIETARGFTKDKKPLTDLTAGEVGYQYLREARERALALNPDFKFLSQNATSISHNGVKEAPANIYPWIQKNAERLKIRKYSETVDLYTAEIDAHHTPRDGRYPLTYEKMSLALSSLVETTGRPLMAWAFLVNPFYGEYSVASMRPYLATHLASRTQVHDHFHFYGGALSDGRHSPASRAFLRYNRFLARFSYYLTHPDLRWMLDADKHLEVSASRPLFWDKTVYRRQRPDGKREIVINLLNLPTNGTIIDQQEIPPIAQNVTLSISADLRPRRVACIIADDTSLRSLVLQADRKSEREQTYRVPPVVCWTLLVVETQ